MARLTCALFRGNARVLSVPHLSWYTRGPGFFYFHHRGQNYHHPVDLFKLYPKSLDIQYISRDYDYTSTKDFLLNLQFYLHLDPGSCSPTSVCLRSPGASTCPIIDAKVTVMLHLKPEWLASLVITCCEILHFEQYFWHFLNQQMACR